MSANDILMNLRPQGKVMVVFPVCDGRDGVRFEPADCMIEDKFQRDAWRFPGRFYTLAGDVEAPPRWTVDRSPATPEAKRIEEVYGLPVTACYHDPRRPPKRRAPRNAPRSWECHAVILPPLPD